jgi:hypothetical protein
MLFSWWFCEKTEKPYYNFPESADILTGKGVLTGYNPNYRNYKASMKGETYGSKNRIRKPYE